MRSSTEMLFGFACIGVFLACNSYILRNIQEEENIKLKTINLCLLNAVLLKKLAKTVKTETLEEAEVDNG